MGMRRNIQLTNVLTLGTKEEIIPYDFSYLGWEAREITEFIHDTAYAELVARPINSLCWSVRVDNMFRANKLNSIGMVMNISIESINNLYGCGFKTRREVYEVFESYGIVLDQWHPDRYYDKY